jgi:hypothetical protein
MLGGSAESQYLGVRSGVITGLPFVVACPDDFPVYCYHGANRNLADCESFLGLFKGGGH